MWYNTLKDVLTKHGFSPGDANPTVFFWFGDKGPIEIAGWYVDDSLLAANLETAMNRMVLGIQGAFDVQDLGEPDRLLGVRIMRN